MKKLLVFLMLLLLPMLLLAQTDSLNVSWNRNTETDMSHYLLDQGINSTTFNQIANVPQTAIGVNPTYIDRPTPPLQGNLYSYRLAAVDSAANQSLYSDTVSVGIPLITTAAIPANLTGEVTIPLDNVFSDPDNIQSELLKIVSNEINCIVTIVATNLVITPPNNFLGNGSFAVTLTDPVEFWDGKTINFTIDTQDLTPPAKPTNLIITR